MNEAETRAEHIDPLLRSAGWGVVEGSRIRREHLITDGRLEGQGRRAPQLIADYILEYRNTKVAVVEAKAYDREVSEGLGQAKNYAEKMSLRFAYATNGRGIYAVDMHTGVEGEISGYPTPDELWLRLHDTTDNWRERFAQVTTPDKSGTWNLRFYQEIAVSRVLEKIVEKQSRMLLTLATGTGKTSIAFQIAWKLFQARWNLREWDSPETPTRRPRILFLADRNSLATQAQGDFGAFMAFPEDAMVRISPDQIRKKGAVPKNGSIFFTIFQTFMSGPEKDGKPSPYFGEYPPDFFDLIIIDECHRGGANDESTWRDILEYFAPAVQLGLTATPKRQENADTYKYFGAPVYTYSLKEGINDGFLTPFRVKQIQTTLDEYTFTADDTVVEGEIEAGKVYKESDFNYTIEIKAREQKRVEIFMKSINQNEKTLVFCATQKHALLVRDLINQMKTSKDPNYCQRVTAEDGTLGDEYLRQFQDNERTIPTILTTSQKLSTGVDARNVRNIVLMRPVNSMIEFKQIIGRGTRVFSGKDYFTIYDFVKAHHHFSDPEWDGEPLDSGTEDPSAFGQDEAPMPKTIREPKEGYSERKRVKVKLSDGKERSIQHMSSTTFWDTSGRLMSAKQFMEQLFGRLPELFKNEEELRQLWSDPTTRAKLLISLAEKGFGREQLLQMQHLIEAENSDIFDVLVHVAYAKAPIPRKARADNARLFIQSEFDKKQQDFLDFVLSHYVEQGVDELETAKLVPLLKLRYHDSIDDALRDLGPAEEVGRVFRGFQRWLY